jgi:integrase
MEHRNGAVNHDNAPTLSQLVQQYLRHELPRLAPGTQACVRDTLQQFSKQFGNVLACKLKAFEVLEWIRSHTTWKSAWTRKRVLATVRRLINWAWSVGLVDGNPLKFLEEPTPEPGRAMTEAEFQTVLRHSCPEFKRAFLFLAVTGCRPQEMRELEWSHVDWNRRVVILPHHKTRKKTRAPRIIPLPAMAVKLLLFCWRRSPLALREALKRHTEAGQPMPDLGWLMSYPHKDASKYVFTNSEGGRWTKSALNLYMYRLRERAGLPPDVKIYGLRHRFCTEAVKTGLNAQTVADLMGHASLDLVSYYSHLGKDTEYLVQACEKANGRLLQKGVSP